MPSILWQVLQKKACVGKNWRNTKNQPFINKFHGGVLLKDFPIDKHKIGITFLERMFEAKKNKIYFLGFPFVLYLLISPFYLLPSGLPQVADIMLIISILFSVFFARHGLFVINDMTKCVILFVSWIFTVNLFTALYLNSNKLILPCLYYVYNLIVVLYLAYMCKFYNKDFFRLIFFATSMSVFIQFIAVFASAGSLVGVRQVGFFNNPNQLGYYGLCSLGICLLTRKYADIGWRYLFSLLIAGISLVLFSLSKAAIISSLIVVFGFIFNEKQNKAIVRKKTILFFVFNLFIACSCFIFVGTSHNIIKDRATILMNNVTIRLFQIGQQEDDSLEGRGYGRIIKYPNLIFGGAGEGLTPAEDPRYEDTSLATEIHSIFGTVIFSYGFIGLSIFVCLLYLAIQKNKWVFMLPLLAACLYGVTHQGLRFTHFWILITMTYLNGQGMRVKAGRR
jgi:hypothetical protein